MTQCERVLSMLRAAGKRGVRSDEFFRVGLPRGVARIYDLRKQGYEIDAEPEGKYKRFRLAGVGAVTQRGDSSGLSSENSGVDSGETKSGDRGQAPNRTPGPAEAVSGSLVRSVPSMFDADVEWA